MATRIKNWAVEDRPIERMTEKGVVSLSDAELLGVLVGSGIHGANAVQVAEEMLQKYGGNLNSLGKANIQELTTIPGIGTNTACRIMAAVELGKRRMAAQAEERKEMQSAMAIYNYMHPHMMDLAIEEAWVLLMNQSYKLIKAQRISQGGLTETAVDVRILIKEALLCNATIVALCHNHPSNNSKPSKDDDCLTQRVKKACDTMRIFFADHVIVCDGQYYSFREAGRI